MFPECRNLQKNTSHIVCDLKPGELNLLALQLRFLVVSGITYIFFDRKMLEVKRKWMGVLGFIWLSFFFDLMSRMLSAACRPLCWALERRPPVGVSRVGGKRWKE